MTTATQKAFEDGFAMATRLAIDQLYHRVSKKSDLRRVVGMREFDNLVVRLVNYQHLLKEGRIKP
jgi:hypothetical protein